MRAYYWYDGACHACDDRGGRMVLPVRVESSGRDFAEVTTVTLDATVIHEIATGSRFVLYLPAGESFDEGRHGPALKEARR